MTTLSHHAVTQKFSKPADPSAPSFLNLPGEKRNAVYEALFKIEGGSKLLREGENLEMRHPDSTTIYGTSILACCQQVHTEAAGILYGANAFNLAAKENYRAHYHICGEAAAWLTRIGRQASLVAQLLIALRKPPGATFPVNILPILQQLWKHTDSNLGIRFTLEEDCDELDQDHKSMSVNAERMNLALSHLTSDNHLDIRKFNRFSNLLQMIHLIDGRFGSVYLYHPDRWWNPNMVFEFTANEQGVYRTIREHEPPSLRLLLENHDSHKRIMQDIIASDETVTFDLIKRTTSPALPGMLWASQVLRIYAMDRLTSNALEAKATISALRTLCLAEHLELLSRWPSVHDLHPQRYEHWPYPSTIVLRFDLPEQARLSHLRIDALAIVAMTWQYPYTTPIRVELAQWTDPEDGKYTVQLSDVRHAALLALDEFSKEHPVYDQGKSPTVWIDGRGMARETELLIQANTAVTVRNCNTSNSMTIVREKASHIRHLFMSRQGNDHHVFGYDPIAPQAKYIEEFCSKLPSYEQW